MRDVDSLKCLEWTLVDEAVKVTKRQPLAVRSSDTRGDVRSPKILVLHGFDRVRRVNPGEEMVLLGRAEGTSSYHKMNSST